MCDSAWLVGPAYLARKHVVEVMVGLRRYLISDVSHLALVSRYRAIAFREEVRAAGQSGFVVKRPKTRRQKKPKMAAAKAQTANSM